MSVSFGIQDMRRMIRNLQSALCIQEFTFALSHLAASPSKRKWNGEETEDEDVDETSREEKDNERGSDR